MGQVAKTVEWTDASDVALQALRLREAEDGESDPNDEESQNSLNGEAAWPQAQSFTFEDAGRGSGIMACAPAVAASPDGSSEHHVRTNPYQEEEPYSEDDFRSGATTLLPAWVARDAEEDDAGPVVPVVHALMRALADVNVALASVHAHAALVASVESREALEGLVFAVERWRTHLLEYTSELALLDRGTLDGWRSLPEYSSAYVLAVVDPALRAARLVPSAARFLGPLEAAIARASASLRVDASEPESDAAAFGPREVASLAW